MSRYTKRDEREYDKKRKVETLQNLKLGIKQLKNRKEYKEGKAISAYALSKQTGISYNTIKKYDEIVAFLEKEKNPGVVLKKAVVNTEKIYSIAEAICVIEQLTELYNSTKDKYNNAIKKNTELNLEIVKLTEDIKELNRRLERLSTL